MTKELSVFAVLILLFASNAYAGNETEREKVVSSKWSIVNGKAKVANHYLSDQEHIGQLMGMSMDFGSFYKKSENISWDFNLTYILSPYRAKVDEVSLGNPARTSFIALHNIRADYGTYYNWNPADNFYIKAGGCLDLFTGINIGKPNHVNNLFDLDFQTQLKAAVGVRYGWNFRKFGLYLQGDLAIPFIGGAMSSSPYQGSIDSIFGGEILPGTTNIFCFTSFHNLTGFNTEFELDFVFNKTTLFLSSEYINRWWNLCGIQNYRKYSLSKIGLMVDLVARPRHNLNNRYF